MPQIESPETSPPLEPTLAPEPALAEPTLAPPTTLRDIFPPVRKSHILNCSFPRWHAQYHKITPRARTIPLTPEFLAYLGEDGIILPDDDDDGPISSLSDSEDDSSSDDAPNPTLRFPDVHRQVADAIAVLGGRVAPKLNWSAPKDAAFIAATNTLECRTPSDIYLLLKSSDFVTHDLEHAFDGCDDDHDRPGETDVHVDYHLVLRQWVAVNPSVEFRCFVRGRHLLGVSQRDLNYYEFLAPMKDEIAAAIAAFFDAELRHTFPDAAFVFDVYIPQSDERKKVWLIDINPFAPRTDALLFSWTELLAREVGTEPELRLVGRDDPEAYTFTTSQYSASKMPKEVVDAGLNGEEAIWEFAARWREITREMEAAEADRDSGTAGAA